MQLGCRLRPIGKEALTPQRDLTARLYRQEKPPPILEVQGTIINRSLGEIPEG